jgi:class 3 adenylate cyclase
VDVGAWLRGLGLGQYEQAFRDNDVDADILPELTTDDLTGLGITSIGHRRKLLAAVAALRPGPAPGAATPRAAEPAPGTPSIARSSGAERRQLSVVFVDLVGSTALSARLDPEEMRELLRAYQHAVTAEVERLGGRVAKLLGDGVLAYFGFPWAHEDDAERAVRAGLAAVAVTVALPARGGERLAARVGIATGVVVVGDLIGEGAAREEAVVGETPNLAARVQALAEPGTVVIAERTRQLIGGLFELADLGMRALKGFAEPVRAWRVRGIGHAEGRFEALRGATLTPLVGREQELALLLDRWARAREGEGQVVLLSGEAGIGKSRLVRALRERLAAEPYTPLSYQCSPHHTGSALWPVAEQIERAAGIARDDQPEANLDRLENLLGRATADAAAAVPLVAELLGLPTGDRHPSPDPSPQRRKAKTFEILLGQLTGLAAERPVLVLLEDAHWIDPSTQELFDLAVERLCELPVLLLVTFRPDYHCPWAGHGHATALSLSRLGRQQAAALAGRLAGEQGLPDALVAQIVAKADGVPLFVEELTKAVLETGLAESATDPLAIPSTLHDSLMARLDRLAAVKDVAQTASVIGREFDRGLLAAVAELPEVALNEALTQLIAAELVFPRGGGGYLFKHALVRDAAYHCLLRGERQMLHARVAQALEERFPEVAVTTPEMLAHHLTEAGRGEPAVTYWLRAGRRAAGRCALAEAVAHLTRGVETLALLPEGDERDQAELEFQVALGTHLMPLRGWAAPEVERAWSRARPLAERLGDDERLRRVLWGQCTVEHNRCDLGAAQRTAEELVRRGQARGDLRASTFGYRSMGCVLAHAASFEEARRALEKAAEVGARAGPAAFTDHVYDPVVTSRAYLARCLLHAGYPDEHERVLARALVDTAASGHAPALGYVLFQAAELGVEGRDPRTAQLNVSV